MQNAFIPTERESFTAFVTYEQPTYKELKCRFPHDEPGLNPNVDLSYKDRRLNPIKLCKDISRESRELVFEYVCLDLGSEIGLGGVDEVPTEIIAEMIRRGLRPALYEELLSFAEKFPHEQQEGNIIALGSEMRIGGECPLFRGSQAFACLQGSRPSRYGDYPGRRSLNWVCFDRGMASRHRFLAVRERAISHF